MLKFYVWQTWDPISPQQRHGGSIVEVYRIIEEVLLLSSIISLIFCSLISPYRLISNVVSLLLCHNISKLRTCLNGLKYNFLLDKWAVFVKVMITCELLQTADQFFAFKVPMRIGELNSFCRGIDKAFQIYTQLVTQPIGLYHHHFLSS